MTTRPRRSAAPARPSTAPNDATPTRRAADHRLSRLGRRLVVVARASPLGGHAAARQHAATERHRRPARRLDHDAARRRRQRHRGAIPAPRPTGGTATGRRRRLGRRRSPPENQAFCRDHGRRPARSLTGPDHGTGDDADRSWPTLKTDVPEARPTPRRQLDQARGRQGMNNVIQGVVVERRHPEARRPRLHQRAGGRGAVGPAQLRLRVSDDRPRRRRLIVTGAVAALVAISSACGRLGGNDTSPATARRASRGPPPDGRAPAGAATQAVASPPTSSTERAAARRAIGTRNGEHDT